MSAQQPSKSKWGNFLSGAVAGLESRLDTILASEENAAARNTKQQASTAALQRTESLKSKNEEAGTNRSSSVPPTIADSTDTVPTATSIRAGEAKDFTKPSIDISRSSIDSATLQIASPTSVDINHGDSDEAKTGPDIEDTTTEPLSLSLANTDLPAVNTPMHLSSESASRVSLDTSAENEAASTSSVTEMRLRIAYLEAEHEKKELQRQEEVHEHLERIDALQSKLQYLAKEAADVARNAAAEASKDSLEARLAAKDEQIALLLDEGQRLSRTEVTHAGNVRKLRAKLTEENKTMSEVKKRLANAEKKNIEMENKISRLEIFQKDAAVKTSRIARLEREIGELKSARKMSEATIQVLRQQVEEAQKNADEEGKRQTAAALDSERKVAESLREDLSNANIEKQLSEDRAKAELQSLDESKEREHQRHQAAESGLRNEISILEGRLEVFRVKNEEVNSSSTGDSQAKLMRQVEILQSQYAVASENWQGIENSLQARVAALEQERNDAYRSETEARKKVRELSNRSRRAQEQLEEVTERCQDLDNELKEQHSHAENLQKRVVVFEKSLQDAQKNFEAEQQRWQETTAARIEEERIKWQLQNQPQLQQQAQSLSQHQHQFHLQTSESSRAESPVSNRKFHGQGLEIPGFATFSGGKRSPLISRNPSTDFSIEQRPTSSRRNSGYPLPPRGSDLMMSPINGQESGRSTPWTPPLPGETPSVHTIDADEAVETGSSPHRTVNDMISVSTAGAGPSVQLVERMSAAVRRLETEKAASKDEMARLFSQRDEARKEVVSLMREVEIKRSVEAQAQRLTAKLDELEKRYQTTLEMLGEKSEKVEELEADVADLKKIYKDLVDSTMH